MQIKVVSLNIWDGGRLFEQLVDFCQQEAADVYLFQEVFNNVDPALESRFRAFEELQRRLNLGHATFAPTYTEVIGEQKYLQGNAILSCFPLSDTWAEHYLEPFGEMVNKERTQFPFIPRNIQHARIETGATPLHVFNTQGIWGEDGKDTSRRIEMGTKIALKISDVGSDAAIILAGDFNIDRNTKTIQLIEEKLESVFKDELTTSFNVKRKDLEKYPGYASASVDMMFVSSAAKVLSHRCPQVDVSDHLPLTAVLEI